MNRSVAAILCTVLLVTTLGGPAVALDRPSSITTSVPTTTTVGERVTFQATLGNTSSAHFRWDFDDGTTASGWLVSNTFDTPGRYSVIVVANDDGTRIRDAFTVTVYPDRSGTSQTRLRR